VHTFSWDDLMLENSGTARPGCVTKRYWATYF
jgi:hypothetical protein